MVRAAFIKTALVLAVGAALSVEAFPNKPYGQHNGQYYGQKGSIGLGDTCNNNDINRLCRTDQQPLKCLPRTTGGISFCVTVSQLGQTCNENALCAGNLKCSVGLFQGNGVCVQTYRPPTTY
ncbi:hypothetical protein BDF19DRAFT_453006 [Syncephalis fuscata]|nr:hypothetical protein BDF19DRAFT_453006 [Syncephalis fuscata]